MEEWLVGMLNAIGNGVEQGLVDKLLLTPAQYSDSLYRLSLTVASTAVRPVASIVLAVVCALEFARIGSKVDGDRELGVKMVTVSLIKIMIVFLLASHTELILAGIDEIGKMITGSITTAAPTTGGAEAAGLGDQMRDAIKDAGSMGRIPCLVLLVIPFLVSKLAAIVVTVVVLLRFVQIYLLSAFSPLPIAFFIEDNTRQWGINYFRQYAILVFQCSTLYLAVYMYRAFAKDVMQPGSFRKGDSLSDWILDNFSSLLLASVLLIGIVMVANGIAKKLFGSE